MSEANIVPSVRSQDKPVGIAESVRVDLAERLRIAVGGKLVDRGNRVVAESLRASGHRRTARVDPQNGADHRVEPLGLAGIARVRSAAVAEPQVAAARVEQAVIGRAGLRRRVELDVAERMREIGDDVRHAEQLTPGALEGVRSGVGGVPLGDDVVVGHVGRA